MSDPLFESAFNDYIDPVEEEATLINFLGQTYSEISKYDSHLVSVNPFLAPKKQEFERTAQRILDETKHKNIQQPQQHYQRQPQPNYQPQPQPYQGSPVPYIDLGKPPTVPQLNDPNQLEFSFDNSVTAKSIDEKLDNLEKRLKKLDTMLSKVLSYLESHESQNN
jgi:outer membrane protein OmpA-like peptidoglycan-associated protein